MQKANKESNYKYYFLTTHSLAKGRERIIIYIWNCFFFNTLFCLLFLTLSLFVSYAEFCNNIYFFICEGDILKYLIPLLFGTADHGIETVWILLGFLYFWSGLSKCRSYFYVWTYHYQFLLFSPISSFLCKTFPFM